MYEENNVAHLRRCQTVVRFCFTNLTYIDDMNLSEHIWKQLGKPWNNYYYVKKRNDGYNFKHFNI